ncbi:hypothetical protein [uncultured Oceanisphaera sp.]|uniref:hypothetical protein n=1 Tax=uncultured Oceanisphaera sp. TaxID=353858 RepID=UPI00262C02F8|nr:hypothetical protein [uncultured Oceanisphaera sp.]
MTHRITKNEHIERHMASLLSNEQVPAMTAGRAALVELMRRYLGGLLDTVVTLLEVHKLMYFMQEAGEPLRLKYKKLRMFLMRKIYIMC